MQGEGTCLLLGSRVYADTLRREEWCLSLVTRRPVRVEGGTGGRGLEQGPRKGPSLQTSPGGLSQGPVQGRLAEGGMGSRVGGF